jgi:hypothetical protein
LEQALKIHNHGDDQAEAEAHGTAEIIDAFDHVLESLDEILALTERAFLPDLPDAGR